MIPFIFISAKEISEPRSLFANSVCKLIYRQWDNGCRDLPPSAWKEIGIYYDHFENHVRNIYELIDNEIPLFAYYNLQKLKANNWGFTKEEYEQALNNSESACVEYYGIDSLF